MRIKFEDFNLSGNAFEKDLKPLWKDIESVLTELPLHLKASDQRGKQGKPIFDPVGTNAAIKERLVSRGWSPNVPIPPDFSFLGTDVDFLERGLLVEAQFSNYPFFLNNVVRSALFVKSKVQFGNHEVASVVIITKAHMFPSSNSTLYYEQAINQMKAFAAHGVFDVPIRVVGLFEDVGVERPAIWVKSPGRYSRDLESKKKVKCLLKPGRRADSVCSIEIIANR